VVNCFACFSSSADYDSRAFFLVNFTHCFRVVIFQNMSKLRFLQCAPLGSGQNNSEQFSPMHVITTIRIRCVGVVYSGEYDVCDVTLIYQDSFKPIRKQNMV
jgi:hypothetical protein